MKKQARYYAILIGALAGTWVLGQAAPLLFPLFSHGNESVLLTFFFTLSVLCILSFSVFHTSMNTAIPSFVAAIFFGMAAKPLLLPLVSQPQLLGIIVGLGATLILFSGGLETPFENFKKLLVKILFLSFGGLLITAFLFSFVVTLVGEWFFSPVSITTALLLGAVLASTDPAAIIPILKTFRFHNRANKDVVISESALTDVVGTLLTILFLGVVTSGGVVSSVVHGYRTLFSNVTSVLLIEQIAFGVIFGMLGYGLLLLLNYFKKRHKREYEADAAFFLFVPMMIFALAVSFGGSGYLAAFLAGLLYVLTRHLHDTEQFFNHTIEGFFKPFIFILLGSLINIHDLISYAGVGILSALLFIAVIRPIAVFASLGWWTRHGKEQFSFKDLLFISFIRETGAIPAVLLVTIVSMDLVGLEGLAPIGMWVILVTLIVGPALTPWVVKKLGIAAPIEDTEALSVGLGGKPVVVLASRGGSFARRLPFVADWAVRHGVTAVTLLHCPEDQHSPAFAKRITARAEEEFRKINEDFQASGRPVMAFTVLNRTGFLQNNIDQLAKTESNVTAIFVGRKMLDFHLNEIKQMKVPLFFVD